MPEPRLPPIKIVRIIARLNIGGPAKQAVFLTQRLNNPNFRSALLTGVISSDEALLEEADSLKPSDVYVLPLLGREISWWQDVRTFCELCRTLKTLRPDIVHTHTAKAGTLGRLAAMWTGVPVKVHTFHGHVFREYFGKFQTRAFILLERLLALVSDRIIVVSASQRQELSQEFRIAPQEKFHVIPLGFNLSPFSSAGTMKMARERLHLSSTAYVIGFVGRLVTIKNPFLLLKAFALLTHYRRTGHGQDREKDQELSLLIVGGGSLHKVMQAEVHAQGLSGRVTFCGWQQNMPKVYAAVNVVVLTSLNEGTPVALIEAMASGKPFIATNVGGVSDLMVGKGVQTIADNRGRFTRFENGILVDSQDANAVAGALLYLMMNPDEAQAMGRVGQEHAVMLYDQERLLDDVMSLYRTLLQRKTLSVVS